MGGQMCIEILDKLKDDLAKEEDTALEADVNILLICMPLT